MFPVTQYMTAILFGTLVKDTAWGYIEVKKDIALKVYVVRRVIF